MAEHCTTSRKAHLARAAVGAAIVAGLFGGNIAAASADSAHEQPATVTAHQAADGNKPEKAGIQVTASQVLALARAQIGTSENSDGGGTKYQKWYASTPRAAETVARDGGTTAGYLDAAWCSMFVSWVGNQTGARNLIGWDAYTVAHAKWFADNHRFGDEPKPGAVVFFSWSGSKSIDDIQHVGFVVKDNGNGTISTIEGNTAGTVAARVRSKSQVVGYGYPDYAG
ncbi:CHAP domain-containing protein [Nonomuraea jiangxiensis]|uniref:CHAP domain-containing protein n=1 Tax=Nonomuraea jiangxiensis TaxID=633440 RepID=A0A1G8WHJ8_9ACTN|nr:CHAP domain-containing protein [Nonomuraea jiangxiensis]SDJ77792.1 CHAP domain-containing protein [Nonomuraea jiangxiensis]